MLRRPKWFEFQRVYLAVYVGEESKRYLVPVKHLSFSTFQEMLIMQSQDHDDLDTKIHGPIKLAYTPEILDQTLKLARKT